ncbi:MAG: hypothetical protein ABIH83_03480, partial [Candidatus Micrarchaeota archaeon]
MKKLEKNIENKEAKQAIPASQATVPISYSVSDQAPAFPPHSQAKSDSLQHTPEIDIKSKIISAIPLTKKESTKTVSIKLAVNLKANPHSWAKSVANLGFSEINSTKNSLSLTKIQSLDFENKPHQFIKLSLTKKSLTISYTLLLAQNPIRRKLEAARLAFLTLSSLGMPSLTPPVSAFISQCIDESISFVSADTDILSSKNHEFEKIAKEQNERIQNLYAEREKLAKRSLTDTKKLQELSSQLEKLTSTPDSVIDDNVFAWLLSHDGQINISEFSSQYNFPSARIEHSLDRLCKSGKIARVKK